MAEVLRARFNSDPKPKIHKKPVVQQPTFTFCLDVVQKPATTATAMSIKSPLKRAREPEQFYDEEASDVENENDDPALFSPKKSKNNSGRAIATPKSPRPAQCPPTPPLSHVIKFSAQPMDTATSTSSIATSYGISNNSRPKLKAKGAAKLPFSLHTALSTSTTAATSITSPTAPRSFWRLQADFKSIKKGTKFDIVQDDIVNAGARIIQHEASLMEIDPLNTAAYGIPVGLEHADHNKENNVPDFHLKNTAHLAANVIASARARQVRDAAIAKAGGKRAALGSLDVEAFYAEGLTKDSAQSVESDESVANRIAGAKMFQHKEAEKAAGSCGFTIAEVSDEE